MQMFMTRDELNKCLLWATRYGELLEIESFLDRGADVNTTDCLSDYNSIHCYGDTLLHIAAWNGKTERCRLFLDNGVPINIRNKCGYTPIHRTAVQGHTKTAEFLIDRGADIHARANDGKTPLHDAVAMGHEDLSIFFIKRGADVNATDNDGKSVLDWNCCSSHGFHYSIRLHKILKKNGAN